MTHTKHTFLLIPMLMIGLHPVFINNAQAAAPEKTQEAQTLCESNSKNRWVATSCFEICTPTNAKTNTGGIILSYNDSSNTFTYLPNGYKICELLGNDQDVCNDGYHRSGGLCMKNAQAAAPEITQDTKYKQQTKTNTKDSKEKTCNILHADEQHYDEEQKKCIVTKCDPGYKKNSDATKCVVRKGEECDSKPDDKATTYVYNELAKCVINECDEGYKPNTLKNKCVVDKGGKCTPQTEVTNAASYEYNENAKCVVTECEKGYKVENDECVVDAKTEPQAKQNTKNGKECSKSDLKKLSHATAGTYKCTGNSCTCSATKCEDDYIAKDDVCKVNRLAECSVKPDPYATEYYIEERDGNAVCIIEDCDDTHTVDATYNKCVTFDPLTKELRSKISPFIGEFRAKVSQLQQNNGEE